MNKPTKTVVSPDYALGLYPGAVWKRVDFQIHTPRDNQWKGPTARGDTEEGKRARHEWAEGLLREAKKRGLAAVAITDHHDLAFMEVMKGAAKELAQKDGSAPWVFAGMEVTCSDSCQCLVLLDPNCSLSDAERLFGSGFLNVAKFPYDEEKLPSTAVSGIEIAGFLKNLGKDVVLKDCSLVLPHAGKDHAHKTIFRDGMHERFANLPCDGFYIEHPFEKLEEKHLRRLRGEADGWGKRRRGVLATGDNRSKKFEQLGAHPCWVRMGEPTVESIRQALLADEARITYIEPTLPSQRILSLKVSSTLCGKNFTLSFNDGFNAVIGGRGTGKSAILEYLRFCLGRAIVDVDQSPEGEAARLRDLIVDTLPGGYVKVALVRDGIEETWTRSGDDPSIVRVERADGTEEEITPDIAQERFRARGYHQKQLSSLRAAGAHQVDQITGIAAAELVTEQSENAQEIASATATLAIAFKTLSQRWDLDGQIERARKRVEDLQARCSASQATLKAKGISEEAQATLRLAPEYTQAKQYFVDVESELSELEGEISTLKASLDDLFATPKLSKVNDFAPVEEADRLVGKFRSSARAQLDALLKEREALSKEIVKKKKAFEPLERAFDAKYRKAQTEQRENKQLLEALAKLNRELEEAEKANKTAVAQANKLKNAEQDFNKARKTVERLLEERAALYTRAAEHASKQSHDRLHAQVFSYRPSEEQQSALVQLLHGSRVQRAEELVKTFLAQSDHSAWQQFCDSILEVWKRKATLNPSAGQQDPDSAILAAIRKAFSFASLTNDMAARVWRELSEDRVAATITASPSASVQFNYKDQAGKFIPFLKASPGQQAAALLTLLLNQQAGTLIIDQPEEDLDNRVIMDVVKLLRTTKVNRQLIFATHNANFVVNGDADKVVVVGSLSTEPATSASATVRVAVDGAIETQTVRDGITTIMEGGKEAFELRGRKYAFASPA